MRLNSESHFDQRSDVAPSQGCSILQHDPRRARPVRRVSHYETIRRRDRISRGRRRARLAAPSPHFGLDAMAACKMISRSALPRFAGALVVAAAPLAATAIAHAPETPRISVRADLGPASHIKSSELDRAPTSNPLWAIPLTDLSDTRDRPIFAPSRCPPPPPVVESPYVRPAPPRVDTKPPPQPLTLSLLGTIVGGSSDIALFMEKGSQEVVRLRTGEAHQGWMLRSVQGRQAVLEKGDRQETVTLPVPGDTSPIPGGTIPVAPSPGAVPAMTEIRENSRRQGRRE